jgi:hypothetical protein
MVRTDLLPFVDFLDYSWEKLMQAFDFERLYAGSPHTVAVQRALSDMHDRRAADDFLFLERWEICPLPGPAAALRVSQIRRAHPELAAAIRRELSEG